MGVPNPRDERAERNRGYASVPLSTVIPRIGNAHLQQNPISDSYNLVLWGIRTVYYVAELATIRSISCLSKSFFSDFNKRKQTETDCETMFRIFRIIEIIGQPLISRSDKMGFESACQLACFNKEHRIENEDIIYDDTSSGKIKPKSNNQQST